MTDKFMDLSIEKTNSAYMLFYERVSGLDDDMATPGPSHVVTGKAEEKQQKEGGGAFEVQLSQDLEQWIWQDNVNFIQDNNIFDHTYFK